jgi:hypothetical protein
MTTRETWKAEAAQTTERLEADITYFTRRIARMEAAELAAPHDMRRAELDGLRQVRKILRDTLRGCGYNSILWVPTR